MKKSLIVIALALCASLAQAAAMVTDNQSGGLIVITDRPCKNWPDLKEAYATRVDGSRVEGCWAIFDGLIQIGWGHGQRSSFDPELFRLQDDPAPTRPQKNKLSL